MKFNQFIKILKSIQDEKNECDYVCFSEWIDEINSIVFNFEYEQDAIRNLKDLLEYENLEITEKWRRLQMKKKEESGFRVRTKQNKEKQ